MWATAHLAHPAKPALSQLLYKNGAFQGGGTACPSTPNPNSGFNNIRSDLKDSHLQISICQEHQHFFSAETY